MKAWFMKISSSSSNFQVKLSSLVSDPSPSAPSLNNVKYRRSGSLNPVVVIPRGCHKWSGACVPAPCFSKEKRLDSFLAVFFFCCYFVRGWLEVLRPGDCSDLWDFLHEMQDDQPGENLLDAVRHHQGEAELWLSLYVISGGHTWIQENGGAF